jgi:hypothetical protein
MSVARFGFTLGNELDFADQDVFCVEVDSVAGRSDEFMCRGDVGVIITADVFHNSAPSSKGIAVLRWNVIGEFGVEVLLDDLDIQLQCLEHSRQSVNGNTSNLHATRPFGDVAPGACRGRRVILRLRTIGGAAILCSPAIDGFN